LDIVGGVERFQRGLHVNALFNTAQELKVGDRVKMAGVEIGRVEKISLAENKVKVIMKVHRDANVKTDSTAAIKFAGLLGQNFVSLEFGSASAPPAVEDTYLPTTEQPDLSVIMQKMDNVASGVEKLTSSFTGDKIENLIGPLTDFIKANNAPLTAAIANLQSVSAQIAQGKGTVGRLIADDSLFTSAQNLLTNFQEAGAEIKLTIADAHKIVDDINGGQGSIGKLVKDETLYRETAASMTNLKEILQKINQGQGSVGKMVNDQEFYRNAKLTLQKLDKATEGLEDQGPLSVMGILVNKLF
jgi:phospholipid/cholesterol/gamma-HCH transport system substrate-binding protein